MSASAELLGQAIHILGLGTQRDFGATLLFAQEGTGMDVGHHEGVVDQALHVFAPNTKAALVLEREGKKGNVLSGVDLQALADGESIETHAVEGERVGNMVVDVGGIDVVSYEQGCRLEATGLAAAEGESPRVGAEAGVKASSHIAVEELTSPKRLGEPHDIFGGAGYVGVGENELKLLLGGIVVVVH